MDKVLKLVTQDEGLKKYFAKLTQFLVLFRLNFRLKDLFLAAQNVHKISIKKTGGHKLNY